VKGGTRPGAKPANQHRNQQENDMTINTTDNKALACKMVGGVVLTGAECAQLSDALSAAGFYPEAYWDSAMTNGSECRKGSYWLNWLSFVDSRVAGEQDGLRDGAGSSITRKAGSTRWDIGHVTTFAA